MPAARNRTSFARRLLPYACALVVVLAGCRGPRAVRDPEYAQVARSHVQAIKQPAVAPASATMPVVSQLAGPRPVEEYISFALGQNPRVQAARKRVDAAYWRVPVAGALEDPLIGTRGYPFFPNVPQTASGRMTAEIDVSQKVPWLGKLDRQAQAALAELDMARADLAAAELEVIESVKRAYYELYALQKAIEITRENRRLAHHLSEIAAARFRAAAVSQQDVLRAELAVLEIDNDLIELGQEYQSAQARLARLLHVSPDTEVMALETLEAAALPRDLDALYELAVARRPELHAQLAAVRRDRLLLERTRLDYFPDFTVGFGWGQMTTQRALAPTSDGLDNLGLSLSANVPLYRKRLDAAVREAEARVVAGTRDYDALRDETQERIKELFVEAESRFDLLRLFEHEIIPRADLTFRVSLEAYQTGQVDILQLLDNWQLLLRYRVTYYQLEAQARQTLSSLERLVAGPLMGLRPDAALPAELLPPPDDEMGGGRLGER